MKINNSNNIIDMFLPSYGNHGINQPNWDEERKMFIKDEHESAAGHRSYFGVRISKNFVVMEKVGNYYTQTYINSVILLAYDGKKLKTISQHDFDKVHYDAQLIRSVVEQMIYNYLASQMKFSGRSINEQELKETVKTLVDASYRSIFDQEYKSMLSIVFALIEQGNINN